MSSGHRLFPSANAVQKNEHNTVVAVSVSVIDDCTPTAQKNGNLDWLTNKSFRSDNAIAIAKQHLRTEDSERHRQRLRITTPHPTTSESSDSSSDSSSSSSDSSRSRHSYSKRSREHRHKRGYRAESIDRYRRKSTTSESSDSSSSSSGSSRSRRSYSKRSRKHRHRRDDGAESSDRYRRKRTTSESSDSSSSSSDSSRSGHAYSKRSRKHRHKRDYRAESSDRYRRKSTTSESSDSSSSSRNSSRSRHAYGKRKRKYRNKRDYRAESSDRHGRKSHGRDRHHRDKKRKRRERDSSYSSDESNTRRDPLRSEKRTAGVGEGFRIDVKSDKNNLCFDSLHFTDTVIYRRVGHSCLGLNRRRQSVIWKEASKAKKYKTESSTLRYFTPNIVDLESENVEEGTVLADRSRADIPQERKQRTISYIPIDASATNLPRPDFDPLGVYDPSTQAYLGSDPKPSHINTAKPQHQSAPTSNRLSAFTKTTASYNRHLHDNPQDIPKWLEFIRFQDTAEFDTLVSTSDISGSNAKQSGRKRTAKMIAEKKLAILEKALLKNPDSVPLQLEQLEIGKEFWDMSQQTRQWEKLLKSNPDNIPLWREYLLFKQAYFSAFSVSKVAGLYGRCFRKLVARQKDLDGCEAVELENQLLDLFVSLCHFWRQAGHTEKAVAAYQAMIELNCFCPQQFQQDTHAQGQIAFLETFWDSAEPRFGERGAKGWASWMQKKQRGGWAQIQEPQSDDRALEESSNPSMNSSDQPLWQAWMREEVFREQSHFAPWRPDEAKGETEEDCEDPERMVLFDDIGQALFRLSSQQNQFRLVLFFLDFLGVSVPRCLLEGPGEVANTTGIYLEQPSQILPPVCKPTLTLSGVAGNCRTLEQFERNVDSAKRSRIRDTNTQNKALEDFVEEVFVRIIPVFPEQAQTKLLLMRLDFHIKKALMSTDDKRGQKKRLKDAKRFAKKLLSQEENRNNLDLWAALARWEHSLNNTDEAKRVLQTALIFLGQPKTETDRHAATRLVWTFADMFVQYDSTPASSVGAVNGSNTEVLHLLTAVAEGGVFTPLQEVPGQCVSATRILKARRNYQEMMTQALASYSKECDENTELSEWCRPSGSYIVHLAKCFAIFQYLTVGMKAASVVYESSLSALKRSGSRGSDFTSPRQVRVDQELLTTAHVRLFSAHAYSNPGPLGTLRNLIKTSLADYPSSPELLDAFIHSEAKSHIAGRVRRYFDQVTRRSNHPIQWLFAIRAELLRQEAVLAATTAAEVKDLLAQQIGVSLPESGISNRIRALFDRACESQHSRHCVLLWRMYMQFEVQQGNLKRAESIFYSALQHCPWAKVLYMDAVRYFPTKLQDCQDLLMEKELRIRAPLEEVELLIKT
ncbi:nuclear exosome regulator NRDE2-like isoform X2 [Patiria miniata]|uniref:NRDE-2, necessary for RNA interference-domain-containing protein n=1 Tax=Patiria miniata TaxID=46514 RepID=A0A914B8Y3_PATMI|nr:nuclear exosome regulator NRDE2-like isoform X2 [Patiria miniata]